MPRTILEALHGHSIQESGFVSYQRVATIELGFAITNDSVAVVHPGVGHLPGPPILCFAVTCPFPYFRRENLISHINDLDAL